MSMHCNRLADRLADRHIDRHINRLGLLLYLLALSAGLLSAQKAPAPFRSALPGYQWQFPRDHFAHPDFANEWWYFTGNLTAADGRPFGFELTFFRISPFAGADLQQDFYFAHFAISDLAHGGFHFHERARRGLWGQAGFQRQPSGAFRLWMENWQLQMGPGGPERLDADWGGLSLHLQLGRSPILFNGVHGWSQKGARLGESSYYYSLPRLTADGIIGVGGRRQGVHGLVWMDHEFATNQLAPNQQGWDWMGLQFEPSGASGQTTHGLDLMLFQLRRKDGSKDPHSSATLHSFPPANVATLRSGDFQMTPLRWWKSPVTGIRYPVAWTVAIPSRQITLTVEARQENQELRTRMTGVDYWEGAVKVSGSVAGHPVQGDGYLELTGYGRALSALQAR